MSKEKQSFDIADKLNFEKQRRGEYARRIVEAVRYEGADDHEDVHSILCDYRDEIIAGYRKQNENVIELPCKIGQEVYTSYAMQGWYFRNNDKPYTAKIVFIGLNNSEEMGGGFFNIAYENKGYMMQFKFSDIGKTVFLTREEAEKALAKMKGGAE